jgi:hypothetical protein
MSNTVIGATVEIEYQSIGNVRKALKEANAELIAMQDQFGATSQQAINAAKKVADLKDRIDDARQASDVFDPGKKFQVIADVGSKIAAGFSAVQGAMALVGSESEDLQKALLKVQGAMALAQGLSELKDFGEAWNKVKLFVNNATEGMSAFKKAMIATGIGLFVAAIGALVAYWDDLKDAITGANSVTKAYAESQKEVSKAVSDAKTKFNEVATAISLAKDGVISKDQALEIYNEKLGDTFGRTSSLEVAETRMAKYTSTYLKAIELRTRAQVFYGKAAEAAAKAAAGEGVEPGFWETIGNGILSAGNATVFASRQAQTYGKNVADLNDQQKKFTAEADKLTKDAIVAESQLSELTKDNNKKRTADNKKNAADNKKLNDERINAEKEITQFLEGEYEKRNNIGKEQFEIDIQNTAKLYDEKIALAKKYKLDTEALEMARFNAVGQIVNKESEVRKTIFDKTLGDFKSQVPKISTVDGTITVNAAAEANKRKEIRKNELQEKVQTILQELDAYFNAAKSINAIFTQSNANQLQKLEEQSQMRIKAAGDDKEAVLAIERETAVAKNKLQNEQVKRDKLFAIIEATINTFKAAAQVFARPAGGPPPVSLGIKIAGLVAAIATGIANVAKIRKVKMPAGDVGGGAMPTATSAPIAPQLSPAVQGQALNAEAINNLGNNAMRAYVLNSDIQNNDQRNAYLQRNARIG